MTQTDKPLRSKRPRRPKGRDLRPITANEVAIGLARSPMLTELCAELDHLEDPVATAQPWERGTGRAGRKPLHPPEVMVLFGVVATLVANDRLTQATLQSPEVWEPIRAHLAPLFPAYKGLQPGARGPNRSQFNRFCNKAQNQEFLDSVSTGFETASASLALRMGLCDPDRHQPTNPDLRDLLIGDGTVVKSRFNESKGARQVDRETGEIVFIRHDPDASHQHRKNDADEIIRTDVAGTMFGLLHASTSEVGENVMVAAYHVPDGVSEMQASMDAIRRLKTHRLPGIDGVLYDKAARGVDIQAGFEMGVQIHAKVHLANKKTNTPKQQLIDTGLPARRDGEVVGRVNIVAIAGAAHIQVHIAGKDEHVMLEPGQVLPRPTRASSLGRVYRDYQIPDDARVPARLRGGTVRIRHTTNDDDRKRKLNRTEALRLIAVGHDNFGTVTARSRAESLNEWMKRWWPDKRAPAVGKARQTMRLIFSGIGLNYTAGIRYRERTGTDVLGPPGLLTAAA